ncbi:MAG TPA: hypothetical protein VJ914_39765 [Pseudonocardiaceae bacterium]|nr:hypothetical protein [Pseudonocardiaceae bacterium]
MSRGRCTNSARISSPRCGAAGGLIPTLLVVTGLGGYDQWWALILPGAISVFC